MRTGIGVIFERPQIADCFPKSVICVNTHTMQQLLDLVRSRLSDVRGFAVATINLDHLHKLSKDDSFLRAYQKCDIVTADGAPIAIVGKCLGYGIERVSGADLIRPMARLASELNVPIAILGASEDSCERAAASLKVENPGLCVAYRASPTIDLEKGTADAVSFLERVRDSGARVCFLAFGAPKQEIIAALGREVCPHIGFFCIGAAIDFLSGKQSRAPRIIQAVAMEWLWRLVHNPRRLAIRYMHSFQILPQVIVGSFAFARVQQILR